MEVPQETLLNKILKISLVVLIVVSIGLGAFVFLSINQKTSLSGTSQISPSIATTKSATATPTIAETDDPGDINIGSVEADLKGIETDIKGL